MAISRDLALTKFNTVLSNVRNGGTAVREVVSLSLDNLDGIKRAFSIVPHHTAIWQHTDTIHFAGIYIEQDKGFSYSREYLDLISAGIDTDIKFLNAWNEVNNGGDFGSVPKTKHQATKTSRQQHESYIIADKELGMNVNSAIVGKMRNGRDGVDRTHLISSQITGIENHKGLLIDYDSWLNRTPMNKFEMNVLKMNKSRDVIWTSLVWQNNDGLHLRYTMYDSRYNPIATNEWTDDRWQYIWRYDAYQAKGKEKGKWSDF